MKEQGLSPPLSSNLLKRSLSTFAVNKQIKFETKTSMVRLVEVVDESKEPNNDSYFNDKSLNKSHAINKSHNHSDKKLKERSASSFFKISNFQSAIDILKKNKKGRTKNEIKSLAMFLAEKYTFFKKLNENRDRDKLEAFTRALNLEEFNPGECIIKLGEEGFKFYIILQGKVGIYRSSLTQKLLTLREFILYLHEIKYTEKNEIKLFRIEEANKQIANIMLIKVTNYDIERFPDSNAKKMYTVEDDYKIGEKNEGDEFGEVALLERTKRTATIIASENCFLATIEKYDYNTIIRKLEERKFNSVIEEFRKGYRVMRNWNKKALIKLMGCLMKCKMYHGEYLYEQNGPSDEIFFIINGSFEITSNVSLATCDDFQEYIMNSKSSILQNLKSNSKMSDEQLISLKNDIKGSIKHFYITRIKTALRDKKETISDNLLQTKLKEEQAINGTELFTIRLRNVDHKDVLGLEEAIEFKKRYCSVRCISTEAEIYRLKLDEFINLLNSFEIGYYDINIFIKERKEMLCNQIKKTSLIQKKNKQAIIHLDYKKIVDSDNLKEQIKKDSISKGIKIINSHSKSPLTKKKSLLNTTHFFKAKTKLNFSIDTIFTSKESKQFETMKVNEPSNITKFVIDDIAASKNNSSKRLAYNVHAEASKLKKQKIEEYRLKLEGKNFDQIKGEIFKLVGDRGNNPAKKIVQAPINYDENLLNINSITNMTKNIRNFKISNRLNSARSEKSTNTELKGSNTFNKAGFDSDSKYKRVYSSVKKSSLKSDLQDSRGFSSVSKNTAILHSKSPSLIEIALINKNLTRTRYLNLSPTSESREKKFSRTIIPLSIQMKNFTQIRNKKQKKFLKFSGAS